MTDSEPDSEPSFLETDIERSLANRLDDDTIATRVYDTVANIHEPAPISDICDLAMCSPDEARPVLNLLDELNIITVTTNDSESPQYKRNDSYFRWRRAQELAMEFTLDELDEMDARFRHQIDAYQDMYDANTIEGVENASSNEALREYVRQDMNQWALLKRTRGDIELAKVLCNHSDSNNST